MMTLDYKCVYNKIWIFPSVDCNQTLFCSTLFFISVMYIAF